MEQDLYEVLGVSPRADRAEIKRIYRKLAKRYHPDLNQDPRAEERFKAVAFAYRILSSSTKRALYDRFGARSLRDDFDPATAAYEADPFEARRQEGPSQSQRQQQAPRPSEAQGSTGRSTSGQSKGPRASAMHDFYDGRGKPAQGPAHDKAEDLFIDLVVPLSELFHGTVVKLTPTRQICCERCHGKGSEPGTSARVCGVCNGLGRTRLGAQGSGRACPACDGLGKRLAAPCRQCHGQGLLMRQEKLKIRIPANTHEGAQLRISGRGHQGRHGEPGDLVAVLRIHNDTPFTREGSDLLMELPISVPEAMLGASIAVQTPGGEQRVKVMSGTSSGETLLVRGAGLPREGGLAGDLRVTVKIVVPSSLDETSRQLMEAFAAHNPKSVS